MASRIQQPTPLFPSLPPELRHEIYAYLSQPSTPPTPTCTHLPLSLKTFTCKHTTVQLLPIHHGSTSLLSLPGTQFPEASEYTSWLLTNAVELRISVHFKGRVNTFVQANWDKKMETHLRKLVKSFPWLTKVARYDVQILWDPVDGALKSRGGKRVAGEIPLDMLKCLTRLMHPEVKRNKACVNLVLHLDHGFAVRNAFSDAKFGFQRFLAPFEQDEGLGFKYLVREVRKAKAMPLHCVTPAHPAFLPVPIVDGVTRDKPLIEVGRGGVGWSEWTRGELVVRMTTGTGTAGVGCRVERGQGEMEFPMCHLLAECVEG